SVEFLNNALNYFNDLKTACLSIDQLKEKLQDEAGIKDWQGEMMDDLAEIYDANVKFLDTINNSLTPKVKASFYGKELQKYIDERKKE
ncbi:MAG TPA: hypothetical protein PKI08_03575, partial [Aquaticitalea sp.]|nr:hypothetical protein [Aquaticitalea sp.]